MPRTASRTFARLWVAAACLTTAAACDAQVDSEHQGEVLASIQGSLTSKRAMQLPQAEVSVVWARRSIMGGLVGAEKVEAEGLFPQFHLSLYSPPPDSSLDGFDGPSDGQYGVAYIVVGTPETNYTQMTGWKGVDLSHVLVYLPEDAADGSTIAGFFQGPVAKGFHIYNVKELTTDERNARYACITQLAATISGMPTQHEEFVACPGTDDDSLTIAPNDLDTELAIDVIEDDDIVALINSLPRW